MNYRKNKIKMSNRSILLLTTGTLLFLPLACKIDEPCDPGDTYLDGLCLPEGTVFPVPGSGGSGDGDGDMPGGQNGSGAMGGLGGSPTGDGDGDGDGDGTGGTFEEPNFGVPCTDQSECKGGATCDPVFMVCGGYCGPGDEFEDGCPGNNSCQDVGNGFFVCISNDM